MNRFHPCRASLAIMFATFSGLILLSWPAVISAETTDPQMTTLIVDRAGDPTSSPSTPCQTAVPDDCTLRWAIEEANQLSTATTVNIIFGDAYDISISRSLPAITGNNISIDGEAGASRVEVSSINPAALGFSIAGDNVSLSNMRIQYFIGSQVSVVASAHGAILRELTLFGTSCGATPTDSRTGVYITGFPAIGQSKATLYGVIAACMGNAGVHIDSAANVSIEQEQTTPFGPRNQLNQNRIGILAEESCRVFEKDSFINDNMEDGVYFGHGGGCSNSFQTELIIDADQVNNNGGFGVRVETTDGNSPRRTAVRPDEISGNASGALAVNTTILFRPQVLSYNTTANSLNVRVNNTSDNIYLYKMVGSDPSQPGGGAEFVRSFELGATQINFTLPLDDNPEVTAETAFFVLFEAYSTSNTRGRTSLFSEPFVTNAPTSVAMADRHTDQSHNPTPILTLLVAFGIALLSLKRLRWASKIDSMLPNTAHGKTAL